MIENILLGTPLLSNLIVRLWPNKAKSNRKALLKKLLRDEHYRQGRSFEELARKTGMAKTPQECRDLLAEIGAEGIKLRSGREGWRLSVLAFVLFGAGWLVSHYGTAIAQNPGDEVTVLQRPPVGGMALFFGTPSGVLNVSIFHPERDVDGPFFDCGTTSTSCYLYWVCDSDIAPLDDGIIGADTEPGNINGVLWCPEASGLVISDQDVFFDRR